MKLRPRPRPQLDWSSARTLADLGELTARYLLGEGGNEDSPTHCGPPADETASIADRLAALNRTGLVVTHCSQPGEIDEYGRQRAFVDLFCDEGTHRIVGVACRAAGLGYLSHPPGSKPPRFPWEWSSTTAADVTVDHEGRVYTDVGGWLPPKEVRLFHRRAGCRRQVVAALLGCWQVTAYDPEWGRADLLWDTLAAALGATHQTDTTDIRGPA